MKIKEIAKNFNIDQSKLELFVMRQNEIKTTGFLGDGVADADVPRLVENYKASVAEVEAKAAERERQKREAERKEEERQRGIATILVTSGFNFDGFKVKKYSGFISGDAAIQINRSELFQDSGQLLADSLSLIRIQALKKLKEAAYDLGCNAVIGVDFDYLNFEPESINGTIHVYEPYCICVTANGNAVVIEKE